MRHRTTHIWYRWEDLTYHQTMDLIIHSADDPNKFHIPRRAERIPVYYDYEKNTWKLANGRDYATVN